MYSKPQVQRFGTLRDLTLGGGAVDVDAFASDGSGCFSSQVQVIGSTTTTTYTCLVIAASS